MNRNRSRFDGLSPQQIRDANRKEKRQQLEFDLRAKIRTQINFMKLLDEDKEKLRRLYLNKLGYEPDKPLYKQQWDVRLAYHRDHAALSRDSDFMLFYLEQIDD